MIRTLIKDAIIYDGSGSKPFIADVLIDGKNISKIGTIKEENDCQVVDATGLALSPGFINTHSHMELEIFKHPELESVIQQGITTEILGQDGSSVAPLTDDIVQELADNMAPLAGTLDTSYAWRSFADYMKQAARQKPAVRFESLVGHGTIRMNIMGNDNREPTPEEMQKMRELLAKCMEEGAKGLSFGLIYPPGSYGKTDELIEMAKVVAQYDGIIMVHMRNEKGKLLESIDEMLTMIEQSGARLQISHLKALGHPNWGKVKKALERIDELRNMGFDVTFDQYPWTAACTGLKVCVPQWAFDGGEQGFQVRLKDSEQYKKILEETTEEIKVRGGAESILIASVATEEYAWMAGKKMDFISDKLGMEVGEAVLHILQHEGPAVIAIYFSISEEDVKFVMQSSFHCVCTDGIMGAHPHPRTYSSFPRFLGHYVRDLKLMSMEEAIRHITMEPARRLRLWDRGLIREGMSADLVLFNPDTIIDTNSYLEPDITPLGIEKVWVLGNLKYSNDTDKLL